MLQAVEVNRTKQIRILYFEGCPNHAPVVEMLRRLVRTHRLDAQIEEVEVAPDDVVRLRFLGSPTVHVDGIDIEPAARERKDFAMSCRVYGTPDGLPSEQMLLAALRIDGPMTRASRSDRAGMLTTGGSVLTAILSSACCWLPLLLLTFGASAAGASAFFERWRPVFIAVAVVMLAAGFHSVYLRKRPGACCGDGACNTKRAAPIGTQVMLWISMVVVLGFITFPKWGLVLIDDGQPVLANGLHETATQTTSLTVEGMTCEMCAANLVRRLRAVPGVLDASADHAASSANVVTAAQQTPTNDAIATAVKSAGYTLVGYQVQPVAE